MKLRNWIAGVSLGVFLVSLGLAIYSVVYREELTNPVYELEGSGSPLSAMIVTDVHNHLDTYDNGLSLSKTIEEQKPDYLFLVGDLIDSHTTSLSFLDPLMEAASSIEGLGIYYVHGNHEVELSEDRVRELEDYLDSYGASNINNKTVDIGNGYTLSGILDPGYGRGDDYAAKVQGYLDEASENLDKSKFNILLCHQPGFTMMCSKAGFDLVLSGHTHAGQGYIFGKALFSTSDYVHGLYRRGDFAHIVSAGCGHSYYMSLRFGAPPEIVSLYLR